MINQQAMHRFAHPDRRPAGHVAHVAALVALCVPASATKIERVVSPGGIEFWFVRDGTVPLVSIEFAFRGGAVQDPDDKAGLAEMTVSTLDEGAGDLDGTAFHARMERKAIELQIRASRGIVRGTLRTLKENQDEAFDLLRLALNEPRFDRRRRAHPFAERVVAAAPEHESEFDLEPRLVGHRIPQSSLRTSGQRHA